jgi:hypothetical protein
MALLRVFDRQLVKSELLLQDCQFIRLGILERDPDKTIAALEVRPHRGQRDVGKFLSAIVSDAVNDHRARMIARMCARAQSRYADRGH